MIPADKQSHPHNCPDPDWCRGNREYYWDCQGQATAGRAISPPVDSREPDHTREGIFVYHNCWKCQSGKRACPHGNPRNCEYPHARND